MEEIESLIKKRIGKNPDARVLDSVWTEKGWERIMKMYFVSPSRQEINALRKLAESLEKVSVDSDRTAESSSNNITLLSYPEPAISLPL